LAKVLLQEAEILELLRRHAHRNIARYHGCIVERERIDGLVLDRYPLTLRSRLKDLKIGPSEREKFDIVRCFEGIKAAVQHLHSLGLAHNDLTPDNVMVDKEDVPVVIDFGSCRPFGGGAYYGGDAREDR
jgi:serine/threonine protein kinase